MAKADFSRDYYADLELPPTADVADVKKQFRKLALKYHPDRNPGKEAEVNAKFQTIQAAHEILTSPDQKSKYDSHRNRNATRTAAASGVRGNPWADVSSHYPPPPRRPGQAPTSAARNTNSSSSGQSSSNSHRYSNFNVPPSAKTSKEDLDSRYTAWKNMRPNAAKGYSGQSASATYAANASSRPSASTGKKASATGSASSMPPPPPPPPPPRQPPQPHMPPRSASQRQKANASFGTRRSTGFFPQSPMGGDEPPASNTSNYFTNRTHTSYVNSSDDESGHSPTPKPKASPLRRTSTAGTANNGTIDGSTRDLPDESPFDSRQSTPYQTRGGERLNPFDGVRGPSNLNRTTSQRTVNPQAFRPDFRRRSSSLPDESGNAAKAAATPKKRADGTATDSEATGAATGSTSTSANTSAPRSSSQRAARVSTSSQMPEFEQQYRKVQGEQEKQKQQQQQQQSPATPGAQQFSGPARNEQNTQNPSGDRPRPIFSNLSLDDDIFSTPSTPSDQEANNPFTRASVEDINTRFVSGDKGTAAWEFSAGNGEGESQIRRSQSGSRFGRRSPGKTFTPRPEPGMPPPPPPPPPPSAEESNSTSRTGNDTSGLGGDGNSSATTTTNYFSAGRWESQIGSEHFVPWAGNQPQTEPTRQSTPTQQKARPIKKPKPIQRQNTSSAPREYVVIEDDDANKVDGSTAGNATEAQGPQQPGVGVEDLNSFAEPVAMDIDSPPAMPSNGADWNSNDTKAPPNSSGASSTAHGAPMGLNPEAQTNVARNIPVEPTRPEWRAGHTERAATAAGPAASATKPIGGSEDSDEFRASLADIGKVEPISEATPGIHGRAGAGLGSFNDLQSNLPFESKAASATPAPLRGGAGNSTNRAGVGRGGGGRRKPILFPKAPVAPNPPAALAVSGLHPSPAAWEKYVTEFRHYMQEWAVFNDRFLDHFMARRHNMQRQDPNLDWITGADSDNDGINRYLDWLDDDEEVHARWSSSCSGHDTEVRKFMAFRERYRGT
ncbi:hypothetical protein SEPCBS119000_003499 [Sporothrix epigloea]|uniref:J domain-containing protein n=1 Tax=Sporothrix epigloea TaxID=1892477 RepID=A0ABP0DLY3_9PEZI